MSMSSVPDFMSAGQLLPPRPQTHPGPSNHRSVEAPPAPPPTPEPTAPCGLALCPHNDCTPHPPTDQRSFVPCILATAATIAHHAAMDADDAEWSEDDDNEGGGVPLRASTVEDILSGWVSVEFDERTTTKSFNNPWEYPRVKKSIFKQKTDLSPFPQYDDELATCLLNRSDTGLQMPVRSST
jgi:hypothetical protein